MRDQYNIGIRLKDERKRLGYNQTDFSAVAGMCRKSQVEYESGVRVPDGRYLSAIAAIGADIQYIITGAYSDSIIPTIPNNQYSQKTQVFIKNYEALDKADKRMLERMVRTAYRQVLKRPRKSPD